MWSGEQLGGLLRSNAPKLLPESLLVFFRWRFSKVWEKFTEKKQTLEEECSAAEQFEMQNNRVAVHAPIGLIVNYH